ncbi:hypothetical protein AQI88_38885 [Streptomyces cellostaticus]|uniref:Uncharacterized protein n=2 Tax=Streptomyces cellostaticus TaxID=67285 RepID=A0A117PT47_9ACTN|nr:hypothetical protein AQI88_38885 [Streptomyces cellostaticus]
MPLKMPQRVQVKITIPFVGEISGEWEPDDAERKAAWELYVELVTRIAVVPLQPGQGSLRDATNSLYSLFSITRDILRRYGPQVAPASKHSQISFGVLAVTVLNHALRPFLARWHIQLGTWEAARPADRSALDHEQAWDQAEQFREELEKVRQALVETADVLGTVAGAADLMRSTSISG